MNRTRHHLAAMAFALLPGLFCGKVFAGPITINIPVSLSNLHPDVTTFNIFCRIKDSSGRDFESARTLSSIPVSGGRYSGTVTVTGGADPSVVSQAYSYRCFLQFSIAGAPSVHHPAPVPGERYSETAYTQERLEHDTSATFRPYIEGRF